MTKQEAIVILTITNDNIKNIITRLEKLKSEMVSRADALSVQHLISHYKAELEEKELNLTKL